MQEHPQHLLRCSGATDPTCDLAQGPQCTPIPQPSPDAQQHVHQHRGVAIALQSLAGTIPSTKPTSEITGSGLNEDEQRGQVGTETPCHHHFLFLGLLGSAGTLVPRLPHSCQQTV